MVWEPGFSFFPYFIKTFVDCAKEAYLLPPHGGLASHRGIRQPFLALLAATNYRYAECEDFLCALREVPDLFVDLFRDMSGRVGIQKRLTKDREWMAWEG